MHISAWSLPAIGAVRLTAVTLAALLCLTACAEQEGSPPDPSPRSSATTPSPTPTEDDNGDLPGPPAPDDPTEDDTVLAWLPPGPASPNDPAPESWYVRLANLDCGPLAEDVENALGGRDPLWRGAVLLCRALADGDQAAFEEGAAALAEAPAPDEPDCIERAVHQALTRFVELRRLHPDATAIERRPAAGTACPLGFEGLSRHPTAVADPDLQVSSCGGEQVRVVGRLVDVASVTVGGAPLEVVREAENEYWFEAPPLADPEAEFDVPGEAVAVPVTVLDGQGDVVGTSEMRYFDGSPCSIAPPLDTPSPSPTVPPPPVETTSPPPAAVEPG